MAERQSKVMSCFAAHKLSGSFLFSLSPTLGRLVIIEFVSYTVDSRLCPSMCALFVGNWQYANLDGISVAAQLIVAGRVNVSRWWQAEESHGLSDSHRSIDVCSIKQVGLFDLAVH